MLSTSIAALLLLASVGCQVAAPRQKIENALHDPQDVAVSQEQVRIRMRALIEPLSGAITASADRIMAGTTNRAVRREALIWKLEAVPALREALFRPNPFVAVMDTWVLTIQMGNYFESGPGRAALGDAAPVAVTTCQALTAEIERVAASLVKSGDVSDVREFARKWAGEHPIQHSIASRESTLSRVTERELQETFSTQEVAGNVAVTLDDLSRRLDIFSAQLLDQARWQAELFAMDQAAALGVDRALPLAESAVQSADRTAAAITRLTPSLEASLAVAADAPQLVRTERGAAIEAIHSEMSRFTNFAGDHVLTALNRLTDERAAAVRDLGDRIAIERKVMIGELDRLGLKLVDHAFWRAVQLFAAFAVAAFVAAVILLFLARRLFAANPPAE